MALMRGAGWKRPEEWGEMGEKWRTWSVNGVQFFLQICKTWFTSQTDATQHYAGKKHIRAVNGGRRARYRDVYLSLIILRKIAVSAEIVIAER